MGEFDIIAAITARLAQRDDVLIGPGDDAAQLLTPAGSVLVSTDVLVEHVHFRNDWTTPYLLGRRAAAQNFADIAAMGGTPSAIVAAVAAPAGTDEQWFTEVARGMQAECDVVGASLIGGDLSRGAQQVLAVTVLGNPGAMVVTRSGARIGDVVAVAGRLGWSAAGLLALQHGVAAAPDVLDAYRVPEPPYAAGPEAASAGATAMIDVSDGLLADAAHIADASDVTIELSMAHMGVDAAVRELASLLRIDAAELVLTGGEDHALLATFPDVASVPSSFRVIGTVVERGAHAVLVDGAPHRGPQGHDHFAGASHD